MSLLLTTIVHKRSGLGVPCSERSRSMTIAPFESNHFLCNLTLTCVCPGVHTHCTDTEAKSEGSIWFGQYSLLVSHKGGRELDTKEEHVSAMYWRNLENTPLLRTGLEVLFFLVLHWTPRVVPNGAVTPQEALYQWSLMSVLVYMSNIFKK